MSVPGPLRFRVVADEIVEQGGQVLALLNLDCIPSILDEFTLFIDDVGAAGATDEIHEILYEDEEKVAAEQLTMYRDIREKLGEHVIGGLVPVAVALAYLREAINTAGDDKDTTVTEPVDGPEHDYSEEFDNDDETERQTPDQILYSGEFLGAVPGDGGNVAGGAEG